MARRYTRDKRGRFASVGATARGGRLTRQSGSRYDIQTRSISGERPSGTISRNQRSAPKVAEASAVARRRIRIARPQPPKPTKEDRAIEKVKGLKGADQIGGRSKLTFVPDSMLTPKRRQALGLGAFSSSAESQRYRVSRQSFGSKTGVAISERSGYQASLPKPKPGVIRRPRKRK